ncbi:hypothetical protein [Pseudomonas brassicacearum]|uniref:hypothetical protein n=1 Tax=Pseudomonas brassicacearum TaxID=930166 RepID=UPI001BDDFBE6|nr:hypothetical protein [Pseudomonas brassicacearum]
MKNAISLALLSIACSAAADVQNIKYFYDDSDAVYSIVSFVDSGSAIQATVQRSGTYFTSYTKLELDCANRNVRRMGMYNSLSGVEKAQFDPMEGRIIDGSIANEVAKVLCNDTSLSASKAAPQIEDLPTETQTDDNT